MKKIRVCFAVLVFVLAAMFAAGCGGVSVEAGTYQLSTDASVKIILSFEGEDTAKGTIAFANMDSIFKAIENELVRESNQVTPKYSVILSEGQAANELDLAASIDTTFESVIQGETIDLYVKVSGVKIQFFDENGSPSRVKYLDLRFEYDINAQTITLDLTDMGQEKLVFQKV